VTALVANNGDRAFYLYYAVGNIIFIW